MVRKVFNGPLGSVYLKCCACDPEVGCPASFFGGVTPQEIIHTDYPTEPAPDPVINENLLFDDNVLGGGGSINNYCWWSAYLADSATYAANGQLEPRGQRLEFGREFSVGRIQELLFRDCWRRDATPVGSVTLQLSDYAGNIQEIDLTSQFNSVAGGSAGNTPPVTTTDFSVNVAAYGPIKSITILQGSTTSSNPAWIRIGEITAVSLDCDFDCPTYEYISPQEFSGCDGTPYIINNFTALGTGSGWNLSNVIVVSSNIVQGNGTLDDNLDGTVTYNPDSGDGDVIIDVTYRDTAAPVGCDVTMTSLLSCGCTQPCPNCNPDPPCGVNVRISNEDFQGTNNGYNISGGSCNGGLSTQCPLEMTPTGNVILEITHATDDSFGVGSDPTTEPGFNISYTSAADLALQINSYMNAIMQGIWNVTVGSFGGGSYLEVTSISATASKLALQFFSLTQGLDELRDNFTHTSYQDPCLLNIAGDTDILTGQIHDPTIGCFFESSNNLTCGGTFEGILNLSDIIYNTTGGQYDNGGAGTFVYPISGASIDVTITYDSSPYIEGGDRCVSTTVSPTQTIVYSNKDSFELQIEQALQILLGGTWNVTTTIIGGGFYVTSITGSNTLYNLCALQTVESSATCNPQNENCTNTINNFTNTHEDVITYQFFVKNASNQEIISAKYSSGICSPFECDSIYALNVVFWNNGLDPNGNVLSELEFSSATFNYGLPGPDVPCTSISPPPPVVSVNAPNIYTDWNMSDVFWLDLTKTVTAEHCDINTATFAELGHNGNGTAAINGGDTLEYVPGAETGPVNITYQANCGGVIDQGIVTLNFISAPPPGCADPILNLTCPGQTDGSSQASVTIGGSTSNFGSVITGGSYEVYVCGNLFTSGTFTGTSTVLNLDFSDWLGAVATVTARVTDNCEAGNTSADGSCDIDIVASNTYFVDPVLGSDVGGSGALNDPWASMQHAIDSTGNSVSILLKRGTTHVPADQVLVNQKSAVLLGAYGCGSCPIIDGQNSKPAGSLSTTVGLVEVRDSQNCIVQDLRVTGGLNVGITLRDTTLGSTATDNTIQRCLVDDCGTYGIISTGIAYGGGGTGRILNSSIIDNEVTNVCTLRLVMASQGEALSCERTTGFLISGNEVYNYYKEGIDAKRSSSGTISNNYVHDRHPSSPYGNAGTGIYVDCFDTNESNIVIERNLVHNDSGGITVGAERNGTISDVIVRNNIVYGNSSSTFIIHDQILGTSGVKQNISVYNNTFIANPGQFVVNVTESNPSKVVNVQIKNNILARTVSSFSLIRDASGQLIIDENLLWNAGSSVGSITGTNAIIENPLFKTTSIQKPVRTLGNQSCFTDAALNLNYDIQNGSPVIDACSTDLVTNDFFGNSRPVSGDNDIGAIETPYDGTTPPAPGITVSRFAGLTASQQTAFNAEIASKGTTWGSGGTYVWGTDSSIDRWFHSINHNTNTPGGDPSIIANGDGSLTFKKFPTSVDPHTQLALSASNGSMNPACSNIYTFPNQQYTADFSLEIVDNGTGWYLPSSGIDWVLVYEIWESGGAVSNAPLTITLRPSLGAWDVTLYDTVGMITSGGSRQVTTPGSPVPGSIRTSFWGPGVYNFSLVWNFNAPGVGSLVVSVSGAGGSGQLVNYTGNIAEGTSCGSGQIMFFGNYSSSIPSPYVAEVKFYSITAEKEA